MDPCSDLDRMRSFFSEHGYLFIKGLFPKEKIDSIRHKMFDVLKTHQCMDQDTALPTHPPYRINSPKFYQVIEDAMKREEAHSLAYDQKVTQLLSALLGTQIFPHPNKMFRVCYPFEMNPDDTTPPHQDIYYVKGEKDTFTMWTPLGNYGGGPSSFGRFAQNWTLPHSGGAGKALPLCCGQSIIG